MRSLLSWRGDRAVLCAAVVGLALVTSPASAQRPETAAERCSWEGWLPPAAGRARIRDASALDSAREAALRLELRSGSKAVREQAALRLGAGRQPTTIDALIALTRDREPQVVDAAVRSLGRIGDRGAGAVLVPLLSSGDAHVRQAAAWALGQLEDPAAASALAAVTRDANKHVRTEAVWALGLVGGSVAVPRLVELTRDAQSHVRLAAVCSLAAANGADPTVRSAVAALHADTSAAVPDAAAWALERLSR